MAMSANKLALKVERLEAKLADLQAEQARAIAQETLEVGATYPIHTGKGESAGIVDAVLMAQRFNEEKGKMEYRFQIGDGFDAKFIVGGASKVVWPDSDPDGEGEAGARSSAKLAVLITKVESDIEVAQADLNLAAQRENLEVGRSYFVKVGKGESAQLVEATLIGTGSIFKDRLDAEGEVIGQREIKQLKFFYGEGFDTELVVCTAARVVFPDAEEATEADAVEDEAVGA